MRKKISSGTSLKALREICENLEKLNKRFEVWIDLQKPDETQSQRPFKTPFDVAVLLSLPDHLRKTLMVIGESDCFSAEEVAQQTGRARALESGYLNQLCELGHLKKERRGNKVIFNV